MIGQPGIASTAQRGQGRSAETTLNLAAEHQPARSSRSVVCMSLARFETSEATSEKHSTAPRGRYRSFLVMRPPEAGVEGADASVLRTKITRVKEATPSSRVSTNADAEIRFQSQQVHRYIVDRDRAKWGLAPPNNAPSEKCLSCFCDHNSCKRRSRAADCRCGQNQEITATAHAHCGARILKLNRQPEALLCSHQNAPLA